MKTYTIQIIETASRIIEIELDDEYDANDAIAEVQDDYYDDKIILDYSDFDDVEFFNITND